MKSKEEPEYDTYVMFRSNEMALRKLSPDVELSLRRAIGDYCLFGTLPDFGDDERQAIWDLIFINLRNARNKRVAGAKGGRTTQAAKRKVHKHEASKPEADHKQPQSRNQAVVKQTTSTPQPMDDGNMEEGKMGDGHMDDVSDDVKCDKSEKALTPIQKESFERFWQLYPRKRNRGDAEREWKKLNPDDKLVALILEKVTEAVQFDSQWSDSRYIPYPATWLRNKCWTDIVPHDDARPSGARSKSKGTESIPAALQKRPVPGEVAERFGILDNLTSSFSSHSADSEVAAMLQKITLDADGASEIPSHST